jgi:hypothetical protein
LPAAFGDNRQTDRVRMTTRRRTIAKRLVEAQHTAAMLTTFNEVDMSAVMALRTKRKDQFKERFGVNLGFMSFFTKAVIGALKAFPNLNAEITPAGDEILVKRFYDIGIAVGVEEGLVVPVVRDADKKSFAEIEKTIGDLAARAKENKLKLDELQGGTFTITNGGVFGSLMSTPILNAPQVGILGCTRSRSARSPVTARSSSAHDVRRPVLRSPHRGRRRGRALPRARQAAHRGPRKPAPRRLNQQHRHKWKGRGRFAAPFSCYLGRSGGPDKSYTTFLLRSVDSRRLMNASNSCGLHGL